MPNTDVSSLGGGLLRTSQDSYDVSVESDVIALLRTVHVNTIDPEVKNHLRDLIFAYKQSNKESDLSSLSLAFKELGVTVVGSAVAPTAVVTSVQNASPRISFGITRPLPRFAPVVTSVQEAAPLVANVQTASEPKIVPVAVTPVVAIPSYVEEGTVSLIEEVHIVEPKVIVPEAVLTAVAFPAASNDEVKNEEPVPVVASAPEVVAAVPQNIVPSETVAVTQNVGARITEIKHFVNEKIGNPINLIDAHNEVGREYMNALLDAMKKSNGGTQTEVEEAMVRLEQAFVAVKKAILSPGELASLEVTDTPSVLPTVTPATVTEAATAEPLPQVVEKVSESNPVKITVIPDVIEKVVAEVPEVVTSIPTEVQPLIGEQEESLLPPLTPKFASVARNTGYVHAVAPLEQEITTSQEPLLPVVEQAQQHVATSVSGFHSVAEEKNEEDVVRLQRESIVEAQKQQEAAAVAQMDVLQTPTVTAGLGQLLSEWSLFKSSGIFGTGPSGKDHVLYLKLAPLTMSTVIAGRFDGATNTIKQSIADYMNGWRYEEGIVYEHGETFEHYLRRVIHHILNKQK